MAHEPYDEDTEYKLNDEDEMSHEAQTKGPSVPPQPPKVSKKNIIIFIIIVILAVLIIYKMFSFLFGGTKPAAPQVAPEVGISAPAATEVATPPPTTLLPAAPAKEEVTQPPAEAAVQPSASFEGQMTAIRQENEKLIAKLEQQALQNQTRIGSLEQKITDLKEGVGDLHQGIQDLTTQVKHNQELQKALSVYKARSQKRKEQTIRHIKRYFVRAVIPGRAWLYGADGTSMTVTVGNSIPGYGRITAIDPYSGAVATSSGVKLRYGVSEE